MDVVGKKTVNKLVGVIYDTKQIRDGVCINCFVREPIGCWMAEIELHKPTPQKNMIAVLNVLSVYKLFSSSHVGRRYFNNANYGS